MVQHLTLEGCLSEMKMLERVKYFPRQLLTADDMKADQEYFLNKLRRHNRYLHGWGTVCGLEVLSAATDELPWRVEITKGYALGPWGDEIYVGESVFLDLARCGPGTVTDPCDPEFLHTPGSAAGLQLFMAIKYAECLAKPVRAMPAGCGCEEDACEYSRIRDSFQIECLTELPPSHEAPPGPMLCDLIVGKPFPACPPCPAEPWVVLAQITLPASSSEDVKNRSIDNFTYRRQVFSTTVLQEQLIKCCCKPPQPKPARVLSIQPGNGAEFRMADGNPIDEMPSSILIKFDKDLLADTVKPAIQVTKSIIGQPGTEPFGGSVTYEDEERIARFTPNQPFEASVSLNQRAQYTVTVRGDGPDPIRDIDELALDGDADGIPGGDFESFFTILNDIE